MAAPNLAAPKTITGKMVFTALSSTSEVTLVTNGTASSACLRITALALANVDGTNAVDATVRIYNQSTGGTGYSLVSTLTVPADSTVIALGRDNSVFLEENRRITVQASAANDLDVTMSYEEVT